MVDTVVSGKDPLDIWEESVRRWIKKKDHDEIIGQIGWVSEGVYQTVDIHDNRKMWVRYTETDENGQLTAQSVLHMGQVAPEPDLYVRLGKTPRGDRYIKGRDFYGIGSAGSPDDGSVGIHYHGRYSGRMFTIDDRLRLKFRADVIPSTTRIKIAGGFYEFNGRLYWLNPVEYDWSSKTPVTSGHHAQIVVGIDTSTTPHSITSVNGTSQLAELPLTQATIPNVNFDWNNNIALFSLRLSYGQTTDPQEADFEALLDRVRNIDPPLSMLESEEQVIVDNEITITRSRHLVIYSSFPPSDDLDTISGTEIGEFVILQADTGFEINVLHNEGNILLNSGDDFILTDEKALMLFHGADDMLHDIGATTTGGGGGGGNVTVIDYADARPSTPSTGDLVVIEDGVWNQEVYDGSSWRPMHAGALLTVPDSTGWSWDNQGSATIDSSLGALYLNDPAGTAALAMRLRYRTAPSVPYTITALVQVLMLGVTQPYFGIGFRENSSGKLHALMVNPNVSALQIYSTKFTNATTYSADYTSTQFWGGQDAVWLRIADNNTNRILSISRDGKHFHVFHSISRTDFLTADEVWFGVAPSSATFDTALTVFSWEES